MEYIIVLGLVALIIYIAKQCQASWRGSCSIGFSGRARPVSEAHVTLM
ncbi:hypothetical protein HDC37_003347 [Microbacterium sp. AK009]|nr:hypothetical protein [Microbacterium sp. AK009]NYF18483.1 hypothetical protein [Microbacterium sp. AK009]